MKRILLVTTVPSTIRYILAGQPKFLSSKYDVCIASSPDSDLDYISMSEGVDVYPIKMNRRISVLEDIKSVFDMLFIIHKVKPDVVHSFTPKAGLVCAIAGFIMCSPVRVHTFTGLIFPTKKGFLKNIIKAMDKIVCTLNSSIVAEGVGVKSDLEKITKKKIEIIWNGNVAGVDTDFFSLDNYKYCLNKGEFVDLIRRNDKFKFCYIGRITKDKGIEELVEAFLRLNVDNRYELLIAGSFEDERDINTRIKNEILSNKSIINLGFLQDVRPVLASSDVFILPSYREGFPNSVLQACSMELPCIVTDVSGSNELITDGLNGWIADPASVKSLYQKMKIAANQTADVRNRMGNFSRNMVLEKFDRKEFQKRLISFYESII